MRIIYKICEISLILIFITSTFPIPNVNAEEIKTSIDIINFDEGSEWQIADVKPGGNNTVIFPCTINGSNFDNHNISKIICSLEARSCVFEWSRSGNMIVNECWPVQIIPNEIPAFGPIEFNEVKISMRVSKQIEAEIRADKKMGLNILLPEATNKLGGFSDACHSLTAATTVAIGKEEALIQEMESILKAVS